MQPVVDPLFRLDHDERRPASRNQAVRTPSTLSGKSDEVPMAAPVRPNALQRRVKAEGQTLLEANDRLPEIESDLSSLSDTPGSRSSEWADAAAAAPVSTEDLPDNDVLTAVQPETTLRAQMRMSAEPTVLQGNGGAWLIAEVGPAASGGASVGASSASAEAPGAGAGASSASVGLFSTGWTGLLGLGPLLALASGQSSSSASPVANTSPVTSVTYQLSGVLMAGPMLKAMTVTAYDSQGRVLGTTTTQEDTSTTPSSWGKYKLSFTDAVFSGGAVMLRVTDPDDAQASSQDDYLDEATGKPSDVTDLRAVVWATAPDTANSKAPVTVVVDAHITPLTTIAAELTAPLPAENGKSWVSSKTSSELATMIPANNQKVAALFGLGVNTDVTTLVPLATIKPNNSAVDTANAYGRALAVLSAAQNKNGNLTPATLASSITPITPSSSTTFQFNEEVAAQLKTATEDILSLRLIKPAQAYEIQQATTGNPTAAVDLKFSQATWNLTPSTKPTLDPAAAFGQTVYTLVTASDAPTTTTANTLVLHNIPRSGVNFLLSGADADAFTYQFDPTQGTITLALRTDATGVADADQAQRVNTAKALAQGPTGYTYQVTLTATADVLGTVDTGDDLSSQQDLTLTVKDVTKPVITLREGVTAPTLDVKTMDGVLKPSTTSTAPTVGKAAAISANGFLNLSGLATASNDVEVRYQVTMVLKNKSLGSTQSVTLTDPNFNPANPPAIQLSDSHLKALGDGNIAIITTIVAKDLAGNTSTPFTLNSDEKTIAFKLDTTALAPTVTLVGDVVTYQGTTKVHTSATRQVQLRDLEVGSQVSYAVDNGAVVDLPPLMGTNTSATLDLPTLGNGPHTIQVTQTDAVGNQSIATTLAFNLALDVPTGVDGEITQFALLDPATQVSTEADPRLFWVNDKELPTLSGVVRGTLGPIRWFGA